jgi:TetR/AcrR family transcriptional regulator, ethionamide resistance regulator
VSTSVQRTRRHEQRENTRREILGAADRFLRERPFRELSIDVLMAETDLTRTAFYRHFDDITELVLQLLEDVGAELVEIAARWRQMSGRNYPEPARAALRAIVDFFTRNGPLVRAIVDAAATDERIERAHRGAIEAFIAVVAAGLDALIARGQLAPIDAHAMSRALNLMNEAYLLDQFGSEPFGDPEVAFRTLERVWLGAIGPVLEPGE